MIASSKKMVSDPTSIAELLLGHTVEFEMYRISSSHVHELQSLEYFGASVGHDPGVEEVPELEGELVFFKAFFTAGLRLPAH